MTGKPIDLYNHGDMVRDFTYVDDIVQGVILCLDAGRKGYQVLNLGRGKPEKLVCSVTFFSSNSAF